MNILFIGNSYTYYNDMPKMLESLARAAGFYAEVASVTKGGYTASQGSHRMITKTAGG